MSDSLVDMKRVERRRLEKFHRRAKEWASSKKQFNKHFRVDDRHISKRAADQNSSIRASITDMQIAAIIINGKLNYGNCRESHPSRLAIEGVFKNHGYMEYLTTQKTDWRVVERLLVRVIIQDGAARITVVSVYRLVGKSDEGIPEVDHEIW